MKTLLLPLMPVALFAQPAPHRPMGSPILHHAKELGLSDAQVTQLKAQGEARKDSMRSAHEAFRSAMQQLHHGGDPDAALGQLQTAAGTLRDVMKKAMAEDLAVLTPEQQETFKALKPAMGPHRGMGRMPHPKEG
jgi:Spy/CpxP family protein refolding chaperone